MTNTTDDLQNIEIECGKLSNLFFSSINELKNYAPFIALSNEKNLESSQMNNDRVKIEQIPNYEENKAKYKELIDNNSKEIGTIFNSINGLIDNLKKKEEFKKTDEDLNKSLRNLKENNEHKIESIKEKIKYIDELVTRVKTDNDINKQINNLQKETSFIDFDV